MADPDIKQDCTAHLRRDRGRPCGSAARGVAAVPKGFVGMTLKAEVGSQAELCRPRRWCEIDERQHDHHALWRQLLVIPPVLGEEQHYIV